LQRSVSDTRRSVATRPYESDNISVSLRFPSDRWDKVGHSATQRMWEDNRITGRKSPQL
jgi:hypothetical protein